MADMDTYDDQRGYEDERDYPPRERSRSPGPDRDGDTRIRDEPMNGRVDRGVSQKDDGDYSVNPGSNLFVTGIHPRLSEVEVEELFAKHGAVEKCNIMKDPHTRESRGFGFVKMVTADDAERAREALQGEVIEGRTLSIEKARRAKPRTPTPGKYFGPPKRDDGRPSRGGFGGRDRFDDRSYGRRDDRRGGGGGYRDRYDDRGSGRRDDYGGRGGDRYGRDRYDDRRGYGGGGGGGYSGGYDRPPRGPPADPVAGGYGGSRDPPPPRDYEDRPRRSYD